MRLCVTHHQATAMLRNVEHPIFQRGVKRYFQTTDSGEVTEGGVCWLACWAWTGMGSEQAARDAEVAFDTLLPFTFAEFKRLVPHWQARWNRYRKHYAGPSLAPLLDTVN